MWGDGHLFLPPQEGTALGLCNQGSSGRGMPRGQGSREPSGSPGVTYKEAAVLYSEPASCPHKQGAIPAFLQEVSHHSDVTNESPLLTVGQTTPPPSDQAGISTDSVCSHSAGGRLIC